MGMIGQMQQVEEGMDIEVWIVCLQLGCAENSDYETFWGWISWDDQSKRGQAIGGNNVVYRSMLHLCGVVLMIGMTQHRQEEISTLQVG